MGSTSSLPDKPAKTGSHYYAGLAASQLVHVDKRRLARELKASAVLHESSGRELPIYSARDLTAYAASISKVVAADV